MPSSQDTVAQRIKQKLQTALNPRALDVIDESHLHAGHAGAREGGESHFRILVVADAFEGETRVARQRRINAILREELDGPIHALAMKTLTPAEADAAAAQQQRKLNTMEFPNAPATYALIAANLIASLYALVIDRNFASQFAFNVGAVARKRQHYRIFTSSFLHGDFFHLLFNMMTLIFFGPTVEKILGTDGFLIVFFGAVMASGIVSFYVNRKNLQYTSLGASDGVAATVLSFCVFDPFASIYIFFIPIPIPAILFGVLFIVISAGLIGREAGGRIAHEAHLAGALTGVVLTIVMRPEVVTQLFG